MFRYFGLVFLLAFLSCTQEVVFHFENNTESEVKLWVNAKVSDIISNEALQSQAYELAAGEKFEEIVEFPASEVHNEYKIPYTIKSVYCNNDVVQSEAVSSFEEQSVNAIQPNVWYSGYTLSNASTKSIKKWKVSDAPNNNWLPPLTATNAINPGTSFFGVESAEVQYFKITFTDEQTANFGPYSMEPGKNTLILVQ